MSRHDEPEDRNGGNTDVFKRNQQQFVVDVFD